MILDDPRREARITINIGSLTINEALVYDPRKEEGVLMGFVRGKIKGWIRANYRGFKRTFALAGLPDGLGLTEEIVRRANKEFGWHDVYPKSFEEFKQWAIDHEFLKVREL